MPHYWQGLGLLILLTSLSFGNRENPMVWLLLCFLEGLFGLIGFFVLRRKQSVPHAK